MGKLIEVGCYFALGFTVATYIIFFTSAFRIMSLEKSLTTLVGHIEEQTGVMNENIKTMNHWIDLLTPITVKKKEGRQDD